MIEGIIIVATGIVCALLGYALRASELAQLRAENKRVSEENADLRDFWRHRHNLPSQLGETKKLERGNVSPNPATVEKPKPRYSEGMPDMFQERAAWVAPIKEDSQ